MGAIGVGIDAGPVTVRQARLTLTGSGLTRLTDLASGTAAAAIELIRLEVDTPGGASRQPIGTEALPQLARHSRSTGIGAGAAMSRIGVKHDARVAAWALPGSTRGPAVRRGDCG